MLHVESLGIAVESCIIDAGYNSAGNLDFFYANGFQGLKKINLTIPERKATAFIGPSGCGKSTLLRALNRMYSLYPGQRAEGEILFYGKNILDPSVDVNLLRGMSVGVFFLSFNYHYILWLFVGLTGAFYMAVKSHMPNWRVPFGWKDLTFVTAGCLWVLFVIFMYTRNKV